MIKYNSLTLSLSNIAFYSFNKNLKSLLDSKIFNTF